VSTRRALLLDTNHISSIACAPSGADEAEVLRRLHRGDAALTVSIFQIMELAHPDFAAVGEVKALLRDVPTLLANPFENIQDEEMACMVARAVGLSRRPPRVFARDTSEWGYLLGPVGGSPSDMIDAFTVLTEQRNGILSTAKYGADSSMLKLEAALVRDPALPLTLALEDHLNERRANLPTYGSGLTATEIIQRTGGISDLPSYQVQESLVAERMKHAGQKSTPNDVIDEFIAFHAPYAAVTALDKRTVYRAKLAKLRHAERMTHRLSDIPALLDRVISGELVPQESAW
jgi:hypothetical protein